MPPKEKNQKNKESFATKQPLVEKSRLHVRNKHRERYDFELLIKSCPELASFVILNKYNDTSIDFFNPEAVKMLNKALLKQYYGIDHWDVPAGYLCPPIPGRADYIHHIADLLCSKNYGKMPKGEKINCLDIGVGANCVYPIIGNKEYGWSFIGTDIDAVSIESAAKIVELNSVLKERVVLRLQANPKDIFYGAIRKDELFDLSVCNPPYHPSASEAQRVASKKQSNLKQKTVSQPVLNFGGQTIELACEGGERKFVGKMIYESKRFSNSVFWFSTLVSKQSNLKGVYDALTLAEAVEVRTIPMGQGNKSSRIVAWTYLTPEQQKEWAASRWKLAEC